MEHEKPHTPSLPTPDSSSQQRLMLSFTVANVLDVVSTKYALDTLRFQEINPFAAELFAQNNDESLLAVKFGVMAALLLLYALSQTRAEQSKFKRPVEKSLKISSGILWAIVLMNLSQIVLHHATVG